MSDRILKIGDYVKYLGDYSVGGGPLRNPGIGRVNAFEEQFGVERIDIYLKDRDTNILCDYEKLEPIKTEEKHLHACGYVTEMVGTRKRYRRGMSLISGCALPVFDLQLMVLTGYCVADLTVMPDLNKYLHEAGKFDLKLFYQDHPWVNDINDLFD